MIEIKCTKDTVKVYPTTGVDLPSGVALPMVAPTYSGEKVVLEEGQTVLVEPLNIPAVGGNGGEFTITTDVDVNLVRWHEVDQDPTRADEMQSYTDLNGNNTDENYTAWRLDSMGSYSDKTIRSNAITLTMIGIGVQNPII